MKLKNINGAPAICINEHSSVFHLILLREPYLEKYRSSLEENDCGCLSIGFSLERFWISKGKYDFEYIKEVEAKLKKYEWVKFLWVGISTNPPKWWLENNPEEIQTQTEEKIVSFGSQLWREEVGKALKELINILKETPIFERPSLFRIGGGHTGEWFYIGGPVRYGIDRSPAMRKTWQLWVKNKYKGEEELRNAWKDERVTFEDIDIPTKYEEMTTDCLSFRDPLRSKKVIDFYEFYNEVVADAFIYFAKVVKENIGDKGLVGGFYGHMLDWIGNPFMACHIGHLRLSKVLDSPYVDWIGWPNSYHKRQIGSEAFFVSIEDSIKLHNKLPIAEMDCRTDLTRPEHEICGDRPAYRKDTIEMMKRDFGKTLTRSIDGYWLDLRGGWYDDPELISLILKCRQIHKDSIKMERNSNAEIAVLVDEDSHFYQGLRDTYVVDTFISSEIRACDMLGRIGAPYDIYLLNDIFQNELGKYKMYIFPNAFYIDKNRRAQINKLLKKDGKTLVLLYAPGLINEEGIKEENMKELTGIDLKIDKVSCECFIHITNLEHPITAIGKTSINKGWEEDPKGGIILPFLVFLSMHNYFGVHKSIGPIIYSNDREAIILGKYTYDESKVGFCVKSMPNWHSVFIGTPYAPPSIFRGIAKFSGVHIYNYTDDVCYISKRYIVLHTLGAGKRQISLPKVSNVYDLFSEKQIAKNVTSFEIECPARSTTILMIEPLE